VAAAETAAVAATVGAGVAAVCARIGIKPPVNVIEAKKLTIFNIFLISSSLNY
jgi:hypothetical protein